MKKLTKSLIVLILLAALIGGFLATCRSYPKIETVARTDINGALALDQNWKPEVREQMNHLSFGSRLLPYSWFLHLEVETSSELFRSDTHIEKLGFIPLNKTKTNPDALPLGFAVDKNDEGPWIGLTCTACHTGQLKYQGSRIHIDGGPAMFDFQAFERELQLALNALLHDEEKLQRFAKNIQVNDLSDLKKQIHERFDFISMRIAMNSTDVPYGFGRLDAFGQIFNSIAAEALDLPENVISPDAPTSFPVLWDASHLDVVQWNGSAPNTEPGPIGQNVTTALAVYGTIDLHNNDSLGYHSSVQFENLGTLQANYYLLTAPRWPEDILGEIDYSLAKKGEKLYQDYCLACHALVDASDAKRKIKTTLVPQNEIGTDPVMVNNFVEAKSRTGVLEGRKMLAGLAGESFTDTASTFAIVVHAASGAMANKPFASLRSILKEWQSQFTVELEPQAKNYKARPLNGIWASAPYLHNGSVPTVYDLLLPVEERPREFYVGDLEFDPVKLGLNQSQKKLNKDVAETAKTQNRDEAKNRHLFNTRLYGNSNAGHEFGRTLSENQKLQLIEYLKTL